MNQISIVMNVTLTNVSVYCIASKRDLSTMVLVSADPPGIMFVGFFCEKYLLVIAKYIIPSLVPRPRPAFRRLQYGKAY